MDVDHAPHARRLPGYEIVSELGSYLGTLRYKAVQLALGRPVVLNVLPAETAKSATHAAFFERQRNVCATLRHENVVGAIEAGEFEGSRWFVTEYVEGTTLADLLVNSGPLDVKRAATIALHIARALAHLEGLKLVHREISPRTITLSETGTARLVDFRRAKFLSPGAEETWHDTSINLAFYTSPEIARGGPGVDTRADVYSLGCVLYHLLTGRPPFYGRNVAVILEWQIKRLPRDPRWLREDVPEPLVDVIEACLRKLPEERYATANALCADLESVLAGREPLPPPVPRSGWERPFGKGS